ncbi:hypothetical protein SDC9_127910 [bioreactor metagenome]|uniref:Uncharacterized protein n=1 Tax=bioreactor metagenome TaxID=1076179 RepID=A0A645CVE1_9ZZZZ
MIAILTPVFHNPAPWLALLQGVPHIRKRRFWHVRMTNQIVRLFEQLIQLIAADLNEGVVRMGDIALQIGGRHEGDIIIQRCILLTNVGMRRHDCVLCRLSGC